ncbi:MAG: glutathione S-transferase [Hyphomicrobiales bacterium]
MKLYNLELSGNCYKVRLFAALNNIPLEIIDVDFLGGAHKQPPVIDLNPWGELPVFVDDEFVLRDSQAILVYLASKYESKMSLPKDPKEIAEIMQWLSTAANEIYNGPNAARLVDKFGYDINKEGALKMSDRIMSLIESHLSENKWLALNKPTIADCACMPYLALSHEGGIDLNRYPNIVRWINDIKSLQGFISMPAI